MPVSGIGLQLTLGTSIRARVIGTCRGSCSSGRLTVRTTSESAGPRTRKITWSSDFPCDRFTIHFQNYISGQDAGPFGGRAGDWRYDENIAVFHGHIGADALKGAVEAGLVQLYGVRVEESGVSLRRPSDASIPSMAPYVMAVKSTLSRLTK